MKSNDIKPDAELTPDQVKLVEDLTDLEIKAIDNALLANASDKWRKVAMIVGTTVMKRSCRIKGIPDVYYTQRIQKLVKNSC